MAKYTYTLEFLHDSRWYAPEWLRHENLSFLRGYQFGHHDCPPPRSASRIVRSDGKVVQEFDAAHEVSVGMIAGFPTAEQYEAAAQRALDRAEYIRKRRESK